MKQSSFLGRVVVLALAAGVVAPVLAQQGPPERRGRQLQLEERSDDEQVERARRARGEGQAGGESARGQGGEGGQPNPQAEAVRQDDEAHQRNAQRAAEREAERQARGSAQDRGFERRDVAQERAQQQQVEAARLQQQQQRDLSEQQREAIEVRAQQRRQVEQREAQERGSDRRGDARQGAQREAERFEAEQRQTDRRGYDQVQGERQGYDQRHRRDGEYQVERGDRGLPRSDRRGDERGRLPERERQRLITQQQQSVERYRRDIQRSQSRDYRQFNALQQQRRNQQYRYQQRYWDRQRELQARWSTRRFDYANDPYFYTAASYRYQRGGRYYEVNRYAADLLRQAVQYGYEEGVLAGEADRYDGWRGGYQENYAYLDANYGYDGYYVSQSEYNHYFREGFRRGYEDGFGRRYRYGQQRNGEALILASVLTLILGFEEFR